MTDGEQQGQPTPDPKVAPESLELRARPQPVTRINRKVVIGAAAVLLCLISFIVLLALKPPSLRIAARRSCSMSSTSRSPTRCRSCPPATTA
ncbi:MAG: hypothetical protein WAN86_26640 [Hyphomicrobiaceae bacterium]